MVKCMLLRWNGVKLVRRPSLPTMYRCTCALSFSRTCLSWDANDLNRVDRLFDLIVEHTYKIKMIFLTNMSWQYPNTIEQGNISWNTVYKTKTSRVGNGSKLFLKSILLDLKFQKKENNVELSFGLCSFKENFQKFELTKLIDGLLQFKTVYRIYQGKNECRRTSNCKSVVF